MVSGARLSLAVGVGALAMSAGALVAGLSERFPGNSVEALALLALATQLVLGLAACGGALVSPAPFTLRLGLRAGRLSARSLVLLMVGMLALSHGLDGILELSELREQSALGEITERLRGARGGALWLTLIGLAVAPSLAEELLCRGFLQRGLRQRIGAPAAIGISALVFGALHADPVHVAFAAVLGVYLGVAAEWADSTRASIACHLVNNLVAVGAMTAIERAQPAPLLSIPVDLAICLGCLWLVHRDATRGRSAPERASAG